MSQPVIDIQGRMVGLAHPPYVVAELSGNHNGRLDRALALVDAAHTAGADAVKLQTYTADTITIDHDGPEFLIPDGPWAGRKLYELYDEAHTPWEWHEAIFARGRELGITIFSAPFDPTALELLEKLDCPLYKIASFEIVDIPLIQAVAATGKPMILSTGLADADEIGAAVDAARSAGARELAVLHCVSSYPAPADQANLRTIAALGGLTRAVVGLSDHTMGSSVAIAAVALGASVIEKHLTMARADGGPDSGFSAEPDELAELVLGVRTAWSAIGTEHLSPTEAELPNRQFRRSLYIVKDVRAGERLTTEHVRSIRPSNGLPPKHLPEVLGRPAARDLPRGTPLTWSDLAPDGAS